MVKEGVNQPEVIYSDVLGPFFRKISLHIYVWRRMYLV